MADDLGWDVSAALLRRNTGIESLIEDLAGVLGKALPGRIDIDRTGRLRGHKVRQLTADLGDQRFRITIDGGQTTAWTDRIVRDVCIKSAEVAVDDWLTQLGEALAHEAERSTNLRLALEQNLR